MTLRVAATAFTLLALLPGCAKTPAPPDKSPTPSAATASSPPVASSTPSTATPRWVGDGCHAGVGDDGSAREQSTRIAAACAPGAQPLGEPRSLSGPGQASFSLGSKAGCVRVIAVAERRDADVTLELVDDKGLSHGSDSLPGPVALAGPRGPVCFAAGGELTAKVGLSAGAGAVVVSAYRMQ